ncbi:precorrin-2 dehydrogenase/sirohydrochlorin ferrochelatase family protein [Tautonia marina]|uniref:precorrin-2 dehydrogenase/sirohydrochlorin ferrochelatase family protein n=1 Tax=Tautonia marina TaxID=2653855 RepID=UPI001260C9E2|nr:bifunctional precorrin-2 dehydrogenase/sirohydrochlorin ferrochelatase [Tautonia marina]
MSGYPMVFHLAGRLAVVVGLGAVGRRKTLGLLEAGARVKGIDPAGWGAEPPSDLSVVREAYQDAHLRDAVLVFAAASPEVNSEVVRDAHRRGLLVNSASEPASGDFSVPASWRSGPIMLSVSTSGAGPALASALRDRAARAIGPAASDHVKLLVELRPLVLQQIREEATRRALLRAWSDDRWLELWEQQGRDVVRAELLRMLDQFKIEHNQI